MDVSTDNFVQLTLILEEIIKMANILGFISTLTIGFAMAQEDFWPPLQVKIPGSNFTERGVQKLHTYRATH